MNQSERIYNIEETVHYLASKMEKDNRLILSLLKPTSGKLLIDSKTLKKDQISLWQKSCSYVPQSINLLNADFIRNIAYGLEDHEINFKKVNLIFEKNFFIKNNIYLENLILGNGLIKINQKKESKEKLFFSDIQSPLKNTKTNKKPNSNRKFVVKNLFIDSDLILKDKSENEYLLYLA